MIAVDHLLSTYGYAALFALVAGESLGLPLPGETTLIAAAAYAATTHRLSIWLVFVIAAVAGAFGDNVGYLIGARGGYALARRLGPRLGFGESKLKVARLLFDRHGPKVVFFGRFVSVLRMFAAFLAGTSRMRWRRFLLANLAGAAVWAAAFTAAGGAAGNALRHLSGTIDLVVAAAAVAAVGSATLALRRVAGRLALAAEAAYPGPLE